MQLQFLPGTRKRGVTITGAPQSVAQAQALISQRLAAAAQGLDSGGMSTGLHGPHPSPPMHYTTAGGSPTPQHGPGHGHGHPQPGMYSNYTSAMNGGHMGHTPHMVNTGPPTMPPTPVSSYGNLAAPPLGAHASAAETPTGAAMHPSQGHFRVQSNSPLPAAAHMPAGFMRDMSNSSLNGYEPQPSYVSGNGDGGHWSVTGYAAN